MAERDEERRQALERMSQVFGDRLNAAQFLVQYNNLGDRDRRRDFLRAVRLYQNAIRCGGCDVEIARDVEIAMLCSSIESISGGQPTTIFKDWLIEHKLAVLSNKSREEIRTVLNRCYQEYVEREVNREGIFHNFRQFLLENCPEELRNAPIRTRRRNQTLRPATFEESLYYIYSRFRSLFLHRGLGRATSRPPPELEDIHLITLMLDWDRQRRRSWSVRVEQVVEWFENVVKESLFHYLTQAE